MSADERVCALETLEMPLSLVTTPVGPIGRLAGGLWLVAGGTRARSSSCARRVDVKGRAMEVCGGQVGTGVCGDGHACRCVHDSGLALAEDGDGDAG